MEDTNKNKPILAKMYNRIIIIMIIDNCEKKPEELEIKLDIIKIAIKLSCFYLKRTGTKNQARKRMII